MGGRQASPVSFRMSFVVCKRTNYFVKEAQSLRVCHGKADCGKLPYFKDNYIFPFGIWFQFKKQSHNQNRKIVAHSRYSIGSA